MRYTPPSLIVLSIISCGAQCAEVYNNEDYGFSVGPVPNVESCLAQPPSPNHGIGFIIEGSGTCGDFLHARRRIDVFAYYNVLSVANLKELRNSGCNQAGEWHDGGKEISIPKIKTQSCAVRSSNGMSAFLVFSQNCPDRNAINCINYEISLSTPNSTFNQDMAVFRDIARTVRFSRIETTAVKPSP